MRHLLLTAIALTACAPGLPPSLHLTIDGSTVPGCAFYTRNGDVIHLWLHPAPGSAVQSLEFGLSVRGPAPLVLPLWPIDYVFEGELPRWRREGGGYGIAFMRPGTLWFVQSGRVVVDRLDDDRLIGSFEANAVFRPPRLDATTVVRRSFTGRFVAPHDREYERFVYRTPAEFNKPPPRHVCDRDRRAERGVLPTNAEL